MTFTAVVLTFLFAVASPHEMLQSAQTNLRAERWEEAAKTLDKLVSSTDDQDATVHYDRGVAYYNLKRFDVAANAFEEAMVKSDDPALASYSAYNFGNAMYQSAMGDLEGTSSQGDVHEALGALKTAKNQIGQAIEGYRRSIQRDPLDSDARANGELAWNMLQQLSKMQEQMEQQQQEDSNQEQDEESAEQQADNQQNKEQGDSQQVQKQQGEESQDEEEGEQSSNARGSEQGQPSLQKQKSQDSANPEQDQQQSNQDRREQGDQQEGDPSENSRDEQQDANEADPSEDLQQQDEDQGELETLQGEDALPSQNEEKGKGQRLSRNEAARLLQLIRDKEKERRKTLAAKRAARRVPVQKDW